jgi:hypothetical protein
LFQVIEWLTGFDRKRLQELIEEKVTEDGENTKINQT